MYLPYLLALFHIPVLCSALANSSTVDTCSHNCSENTVSEFQATSLFNHCMKQCTTQQGKSWPLNSTDYCEKELMSPDPDESKNVCSAQSAWVATSYYEVSVSTEFRQHLIVYWRPCAVAIEHLTGYEIVLDESSAPGFYVDCVKVSLARTLVPKNQESVFAVLFSNVLKYNTQYTVTLHGVPKRPGNVVVELQFQSMSCSKLYGFGSCSCELIEYNPLPPPNVTVSGYLVKISVEPLQPCFDIRRYILNIRLLNGSVPIPGINIRREWKKGHKFMTETFYPLYPKNDSNLQFAVKYKAVSGSIAQSDSESIPIKIVQWSPCKPNIDIVGSDITITWCCSPVVYSISRFEVKVIHNNSQSNVFTVDSSCQNHYSMSTTIVSLSPGVYSSQIREWRDPKYNSHAIWSPVSNTVVSPNNQAVESHLFIAAIAIIVFVIIVALVISMLYFKKLYMKVQRLPESVRNAISGTSPDQVHVCKTVWVVWQADNQNDSVAGEVHSENIRHLASFLANHCGLHIILDQYEVTVAPSLTSWLKEKQKAVDIVIFVCPHQPVTELDCSQLVGNFISVYNLYESALLFENYSVKFASVMLPYSNPSFYGEAKMLLHKIPSFKLMDDIDNLYFFIQNRAKAGPYGRRVLEYINGRDFSKTQEGAKLKAGFQEMLQILSGEGRSLITSPQESILSSEHIQERELEICDIADQEIPLQCSDGFEPQPPPPIQSQEDTDHAVFMVNTNDLLSQQPIESVSIEAVTFDSNCPLLAPSPISTMSF